jgi:hypothetical protein
MKNFGSCAVLIAALAVATFAQGSMDDMPGMKMGTSSADSGLGLNSATSAMEHEHMEMGPHMKMTAPRPANAADQERAQQIVIEARSALEKYTDYRQALADGYKIFAPKIQAKMKHFTNYKYAFEAAYKFDPEHPTSLLYEKHGDNYKLIGAMYTAPRTFSEDELNARVPLSVAQWHEHVNLCFPPKSRSSEMFRKNAEFGLAGSIATEDACNAAGGRWMPQVFGWMVHFYPWEKTPDQIWSVERQAVAHRD